MILTGQETVVAPVQLGQVLVEIIHLVHITYIHARRAYFSLVNVFCSPEPLGSQGELVIYPSSRRPSVRPSSSSS